MAKCKFWVETITEYIAKVHDPEIDRLYEVRLKVNGDMHLATAELKSTKNKGGLAWDWAQSHWDEFIPEEGPPLSIDCGDGVTRTFPTELRWACVQGVYADEQKERHLPITEVTGKAANNSNYARAGTAKRGKSTPKFKAKTETNSKKTKGSALPQRGSAGLKGGIAKPKDQTDPKNQVSPRSNVSPSDTSSILPPNITSTVNIEDIKAQKIAAAMEKEEEEVN
jgi:hypothetical protein